MLKTNNQYLNTVTGDISRILQLQYQYLFLRRDVKLGQYGSTSVSNDRGPEGETNSCSHKRYTKYHKGIFIHQKIIIHDVKYIKWTRFASSGLEEDRQIYRYRDSYYVHYRLNWDSMRIKLNYYQQKMTITIIVEAVIAQWQRGRFRC